MHRCNFCEIQNAFNLIMKIFIKKLDLCSLLSTYSRFHDILNKHSKQKESLNTVLIIYTIVYLLVYMIKEKRNRSKMRRNNKNTQGIKSYWRSYQKISRLSYYFLNHNNMPKKYYDDALKMFVFLKETHLVWEIYHMWHICNMIKHL